MLITKGGLCCAVSTVLVLVIRVIIFFATQTCCFESFNAAVHIMKIIQYLILGMSPPLPPLLFSCFSYISYISYISSNISSSVSYNHTYHPISHPRYVTALAAASVFLFFIHIIHIIHIIQHLILGILQSYISSDIASSVSYRPRRRFCFPVFIHVEAHFFYSRVRTYICFFFTCVLCTYICGGALYT